MDFEKLFAILLIASILVLSIYIYNYIFTYTRNVIIPRSNIAILQKDSQV